MRSIDLTIADLLNEDSNNQGDPMLEELKTKLEEVLAVVTSAQEASATPSADATVVAAVVAALEAAGYTVTPPAPAE